jgi:hypothetical protein
MIPRPRAGIAGAPTGEEEGNLMGPPPDRGALPPWIQIQMPTVPCIPIGYNLWI